MKTWECRQKWLESIILILVGTTLGLYVLVLVCLCVVRRFVCLMGGSVKNQFGEGPFIGIDCTGGSVLPVGYLSISDICIHRYRNLTGGSLGLCSESI